MAKHLHLSEILGATHAQHGSTLAPCLIRWSYASPIPAPCRSDVCSVLLAMIGWGIVMSHVMAHFSRMQCKPRSCWKLTPKYVTVSWPYIEQKYLRLEICQQKQPTYAPSHLWNIYKNCRHVGKYTILTSLIGGRLVLRLHVLCFLVIGVSSMFVCLKIYMERHEKWPISLWLIEHIHFYIMYHIYLCIIYIDIHMYIYIYIYLVYIKISSQNRYHAVFLLSAISSLLCPGANPLVYLGVSMAMGVPQELDGLQGKILRKWMIGGYPLSEETAISTLNSPSH